MKKTATIAIDDIAEIGEELREQELAEVAGGKRIIIIVVVGASTCALGGGYDAD
jgi:lactobin A/cerein 7B family class IIb bacteriocin